jgi:hypothetical protein
MAASTDPIPLEERYRLPVDFTSNERPKTMTLEDLDLSQVEMYRQSHLNSENRECTLRAIEHASSWYIPFEHSASETAVHEWTQTPESPIYDS